MHEVRIALADNGYVLKFDDPEILERNRDSDRWQDPERQRVYSSPEALVADLSNLLPLLEKGEDESSDTYKGALAEAFSKEDPND